ncbi:hypothetical protein CONLIGDRAFT_684151 [Coniochaeta ligniaria NRRL 30616]|uniref:Uncharacterized protein n=1 Tax=Coniochaeta ligniaria NRRL 30616 TaxID=1408157 RepID=A0A1J7IDW6_9PEZI|nr:hypothetical protein CONLIGDRAFT_684151 [Coniochaeta ligniaria NRRL 30616]
MQAVLGTHTPSMARGLATGLSRAFTSRPRPSIASRLARQATSTRSAYSTVIYQGQNPASKERKIDDTQVYGSEVKLNPSESEADVAADRGEMDPLRKETRDTILIVDAVKVHKCERPTDSQQAVHADRYMPDPLKEKHVRIVLEGDECHPTASEEAVHADRYMPDPLKGKDLKHATVFVEGEATILVEGDEGNKRVWATDSEEAGRADRHMPDPLKGKPGGSSQVHG